MRVRHIHTFVGERLNPNFIPFFFQSSPCSGSTQTVNRSQPGLRLTTTRAWRNTCSKSSLSPASIFLSGACLSHYLHLSTPSDYPVAYGSWPTLSQLISDNTRVVSFIASEADYSSVPYLLVSFFFKEIMSRD